MVPGIGGSEPAHWQSRWQSVLLDAHRIAPRSWDEPDLDDWVDAIDRAVGHARPVPVLVAHSLGCLAVAHWAVRVDDAATRVAGAFLVAPPDPACPEFPAAAPTFTIANAPLPIPAIVLSSSDDPYCSPDRAADMADVWGAQLVELGPRGHVNVASGFGEWPEGLQLLEDFVLTARETARQAG
ncbi:putative alpha/beta hydrolase family esterase [Agromyces flavus]|nr:alpha/beta fold hydrolase [Agromyces flavus]MCP2366763.1 putative alpha/beta hydrolase family esterase [Agromyces flavus]